MKNTKLFDELTLWVEGSHDEHFFKKLLAHIGFKDVHIFNTNGKDNFSNCFGRLCKQDTEIIKRICFVQDADKNPAKSAFDSICHYLKKDESPFPVPEEISDMTEGNPKCGIFIMPDNESKGTIESLCLKSIKDKEIFKSIEQYLDAVEENDAKMYRKLNLPKSQILAYLAGKHPYSYSVGLGTQQGHFDLDHPCFDKLKDFLKRLYK